MYYKEVCVYLLMVDDLFERKKTKKLLDCKTLKTLIILILQEQSALGMYCLQSCSFCWVIMTRVEGENLFTANQPCVKKYRVKLVCIVLFLAITDFLGSKQGLNQPTHLLSLSLHRPLDASMDSVLQ